MEQEVDPPEYIKYLLANANFMQNIRAYNQMFVVTSFGANIDTTVNQRRGPYVFKVSSQIYNIRLARCVLPVMMIRVSCSSIFTTQKTMLGTG